MKLHCLSAFYLAAAAFVPSAVGICVDDPVDWVADHVYDCAYMESQPENCDVIGAGTDGKTASEVRSGKYLFCTNQDDDGIFEFARLRLYVKSNFKNRLLSNFVVLLLSISLGVLCLRWRRRPPMPKRT